MVLLDQSIYLNKLLFHYGNILRYKGHDKDFIDEHLSISDGKTVEFLGVIELHSLDPAEIVKEGDLVNGEIVYSIGTFGLPFILISS